MSYRIGIDVGGTFTDFVLVGAETLNLLKSPTTLEDQSVGVMRGISSLAEAEGTTLGALLEQTELVVHGTTTADNTMIEMNGAVTALLTTEGHRDEIEIRRGFKEEIWDPAHPPPIPIAPRRRRLGVPERLDFRGDVVVPKVKSPHFCVIPAEQAPFLFANVVGFGTGLLAKFRELFGKGNRHDDFPEIVHESRNVVAFILPLHVGGGE